MVRVSKTTTDITTAWRIRDSLAAHPLFGGATAQIEVIARHDCVILEGWTLDEGLIDMAGKLVRRAAGRRTVENRIRANSRSHNRCQAQIQRQQS